MLPDEADVPQVDAVQAMRGRMRRGASGAPGAAESRRLTLTGTVEQGVEGRSVVLLDSSGAPLADLVGRPVQDYRLGAEVRVRGRYLTGLSSAAQQGRPFEVETIEFA